MANGLRNAGAVDLTDGWGVAGGGSPTLSVDDDHWGWSGKALLLSQGTATATNQVTAIQATGAGVGDNRIVVTAGDVLEAYAFCYASKGTGALKVQWEDAGGTVISSSTVTLRRAGNGSPELGSWTGMDWTWDRVTCPVGATRARLRYETTVPSSGTAFKLMLLHPFLGSPVEITPGKDEEAKWDPGSHANADLDLPIWPADVPRFQSDADSTPYPNRSAMQSDSNLPAGRLLYYTPQEAWRGHMRCLDLHLARLQAFHQQGLDSFWFERPDTRQLCIAKWLADGAPKVVSRKGPWMMVEVGLQLKVA